MVKCLENGLKKENAIAKIIYEIIKQFPNVDSLIPHFDKPNREMRSAEDILKDYGLGGGN